MADVIHLGLGAFHRAHQAVFFQDAGLKVVSVSMRKSDVANSFNAHNCKYKVISKDASGQVSQEITAITHALYYPRDLARLKELCRAPELKLITLTVTEKAYQNTGADSLSERLADLLTARYESGAPGLALISCDNMSKNSELIKRLVLEVLQERSDMALTNWVKEEVRAPNSMIDRIVPAITDENLAIFTEPFTQWVIENDPISTILAPAGVQFVPDVRPFEIAKIRLFNGAHSALAYIGELAGIEYVSEVISHPVFGKFVENMQVQEALKSLDNSPGIDLISYAKIIRERIANPTLNHRNQQIAMDGSQKLQQRMIDGANELVKRKIPAPNLCMAIAIWLHYLAVSDRINDPLAKELKALAQGQNPDEVVRSILTLPNFLRPLDQSYFAQISEALQSLRSEPLLDILLL
jgi:fructuronate reductase